MKKIMAIIMAAGMCLCTTAMARNRMPNYQFGGYAQTGSNDSYQGDTYENDEAEYLADKGYEVIEQVNADRERYGLGKLAYDEELTRAAQVRALEISKKFSHARPDGSSWSSVSDAAYAENIAMGYGTVDKVMAAWLSSEGHRANILKASYTSIGVGVCKVDGIIYWVQLFGKS